MTSNTNVKQMVHRFTVFWVTRGMFWLPAPGLLKVEGELGVVWSRPILP